MRPHQGLVAGPAVIRPKVRVRGNLRNGKLLYSAFRKADGSHFTVGVHEDAGSYPATGIGGRNPPKVSEVAWWLEKGTERMPARPFLGPAVDENLEAIKKKVAEGVAQLSTRRWTVEKSLVSVAAFILTLVQNKVKSNTGAPLSGSWEPPRGYLGWKRLHGMAQRTLIATGLMYRSLGFQIVLKGDDRLKSRDTGQDPPGAAPAALEKPSRGRLRGGAQARAGRQASNSEGNATLAAQRAAARALAQTDKRAASGQAPEDRASVGKAHQAANAPRGRYRGK